MSEYINKKIKTVFLLCVVIIMMFVFSFFVFTDNIFTTHAQTPTATDVLKIPGVLALKDVKEEIDSIKDLTFADLLAIPEVLDTSKAKSLLLSGIDLGKLIDVDPVENYLENLGLTDDASKRDYIISKGVVEFLRELGPVNITGEKLEDFLKKIIDVSDFIDLDILDIQGVQNLLDDALNAFDILALDGVDLIQGVRDLFGLDDSGSDGGSGSGGSGSGLPSGGGGDSIPSGIPTSGLTEGAARGAAICAQGDSLPEQDRPTKLGDIAGISRGLFVPVKDFEAENLLRNIAIDTDLISEDIDFIEDNTLAIRYYMKVLCEKEYVHDVQFQNEWARVIGELVKSTNNFVLTAYDDNPIFVNNQYVYYTLVDLAVFKTIIEEIKQSNLGDKGREEIIKSLWLRQYEYLFPHGDKDDPTGSDQWVPDDVVEKVKDVSKRASDDVEGWRAYSALFNRDVKNIPGLHNYVVKELDNRRGRALELEREKLAWGRGFFSYELCDLKVFSKIRADRRNCRIVTPGALIQDQVSLVFGTAIRQMEAADEFEERIAQNTIVVLNDILNLNGLGSVTKLGKNNYSREANTNTTVVTPATASPLIVSGPPKEKIKEFLPWEFTQVTVTDLTAVGIFRYLIDEAAEKETLTNCPPQC